jgi:hypothetical protein
MNGNRYRLVGCSGYWRIEDMTRTNGRCAPLVVKWVEGDEREAQRELDKLNQADITRAKRKEKASYRPIVCVFCGQESKFSCCERCAARIAQAQLFRSVVMR